jgi:regulatory protein
MSADSYRQSVKKNTFGYPSKRERVSPQGPRSFNEEYQAALRKTEQLLVTRDRSEGELRQRLEQAGFTALVIEPLIERAVETGILDDARFSSAYVRGKLHLGWGRRRIEAEIRRFGVTLTAMDGYPEAFFEGDSELQRAVAALAHFHSNAKNQQQARYRHLIFKGFSAEIAQKALAQLTVCDGCPTI